MYQLLIYYTNIKSIKKIECKYITLTINIVKKISELKYFNKALLK